MLFPSLLAYLNPFAPWKPDVTATAYVQQLFLYFLFTGHSSLSERSWKECSCIYQGSALAYLSYSQVSGRVSSVGTVGVHGCHSRGTQLWRALTSRWIWVKNKQTNKPVWLLADRPQVYTGIMVLLRAQAWESHCLSWSSNCTTENLVSYVLLYVGFLVRQMGMKIMLTSQRCWER